VLRNLTARLASGGVLIAGFQLRAGGLSADEYDDCVRAAGLQPSTRFATWGGAPFVTGSDYVVAVSKREPMPGSVMKDDPYVVAVSKR
jgi:hypothetical protein